MAWWQGRRDNAKLPTPSGDIDKAIRYITEGSERKCEGVILEVEDIPDQEYTGIGENWSLGMR